MSSQMSDFVQIADRCIRDLQRDLAGRDQTIRARERQVAGLERALHDALKLREEAAQREAACERELDRCRRAHAELEDRCAVLERDKQMLEARLERASAWRSEEDEEDEDERAEDEAEREEDEAERDENDEDENEGVYVAIFDELDPRERDAIRRRVRCEQALRARLAKTDMCPRARLRTLVQGKRAGLLSRELEAELRRRKSNYG